MTPIDLLLWAASIAGATLLLSIATIFAVGTVRAVKGPKKSLYTAPVTKLKLVKDISGETIPPTP